MVNGTNKGKSVKSLQTFCNVSCSDITKKALANILRKYKTEKALLKSSFKLNPCEQTLKEYLDLELKLKKDIAKLTAY